MDLGFVSAVLADENFEYVIDFASENKFKSVEVMCWPVGKSDRRYAGVTHINMDDLGTEKVKYINDYLNKKAIKLSALGYYPNPLDPDIKKREIYIEHIKKLILAAPRLGVDTVTTFIGRNHQTSIKDNMNTFKEVWPDIIKFAEENEVKIAIENCPMFFSMDEWPGGKNLATTPKIWNEMFSIIDSNNFGLNYDPSHLLWQQMDYIKPIYDFREKLFHIHIKDAKIYLEKLNNVGIMATPLEYHTPKIPGLGDINWGRFISALTDIGYTGNVAIEIEDKAFEGTLESRIYAILQSKKYVNQFLL